MTSTIISTPKNIRHTNASIEQKELLLEYMKKHPKLILGKFSNDFTLKDAQSLWQEITNILNSCGGACRDWKSWRKTWHDIRSRTKTKTSKFKSYQKGTGGGPHQGNPNTDYENEVLQTIKLVSIEGHTNVSESSTDFTFDSPEQISYAASKSNSICDMGTMKENNNRVNINELPIPEEKTKSPNEYNDINNSNSLVAPLCGNSKVLNKKIPRGPRKKLVYASEAAENYRISLEKKNNIKSEYYERKIFILERMAISKERSATAKENSAIAQERTASALEDIANYLKNLVETIS